MTNAIRTTKNALMLFSGTMIRMVAMFAFILYAANELGVSGFGKYTLIVHYFELMVSLSSTAACILLTRDAARWSRNRDKLFSSAVIIVSGIAIVAPFVLIPMSLLFGYSNETTMGIVIACVGLVPASIAALYESVFVASERAEFVTIGAAIECVARIAISIALLAFGYGILEISCVMVATRLLLMCSYYFMLRSISKHRWHFSPIATMRFGYRWRVFVLENWMATIYTSLDVIVLSMLVGEAAVGLYRAAWQYVRLGALAARSFTTAVFPSMTRLYNQSRESFLRMFRHTFRAMCMITLPVIAIVSIMPERIVALLYKAQYKDAAPILQVLIWMLLFEFINPFLSHILFSQGKQRYSMYVAAIGLVSNTLLTFSLIYFFGSIGASVACVLSGLIASVCYLYFSSELRLVRSMLLESFRIFLSAFVLGVIVLQITDYSWIVIGAVGMGVYVFVLFVLQAIRIRDIRFLKKQIRRAVA